MISPKFLWDYGHSTIQIWRRYNKLEGKGFTSGWCASLKNASKPRTNLVPRFLSYSPPERKRNLGTRLYKHAITIDRFHMTSRRPYLCTKQCGGHVCVQKKILWELNSFHMLKLSFIPSNLQSCWPCHVTENDLLTSNLQNLLFYWSL